MPPPPPPSRPPTLGAEGRPPITTISPVTALALAATATTPDTPAAAALALSAALARGATWVAVSLPPTADALALEDGGGDGVGRGDLDAVAWCASADASPSDPRRLLAVHDAPQAAALAALASLAGGLSLSTRCAGGFETRTLRLGCHAGRGGAPQSGVAPPPGRATVGTSLVASSLLALQPVRAAAAAGPGGARAVLAAAQEALVRLAVAAPADVELVLTLGDAPPILWRAGRSHGEAAALALGPVLARAAVAGAAALGGVRAAAHAAVPPAGSPGVCADAGGEGGGGGGSPAPPPLLLGPRQFVSAGGAPATPDLAAAVLAAVGPAFTAITRRLRGRSGGGGSGRGSGGGTAAVGAAPLAPAFCVWLEGEGLGGGAGRGGGGVSPGIPATAAAAAAARAAVLAAWHAVAPASLLPDPLAGGPHLLPPSSARPHKRRRGAAAAGEAGAAPRPPPRPLLRPLQPRPAPPARLQPTPFLTCPPPADLALLSLTALAAGDRAGLEALTGGGSPPSRSDLSSSSFVGQLAAPASGRPCFVVLGLSTGPARRLIILDPHAADERVRVEALGGALVGPGGLPATAPATSPLSSAPLPPGPHTLLSLPPRDAAALTAHAPLVRAWGWRWVAGGGGGCVRVTHAPALCFPGEAAAGGGRPASSAAARTTARGPAPPGTLAEYVASLAATAGAGRVPPIIGRALAARACRGALMLGTPLSPATTARLVTALAATASPGVCAHGRPTTVPLVDLRAARRAVEARRRAGGVGGWAGQPPPSPLPALVARLTAAVAAAEAQARGREGACARLTTKGARGE
jgi:hypothetical protein